MDKTIKQDSFIFSLDCPIQVHGKVDGKNTLVEAKELELHCFQPRHKFITLPLRKMYRNAILNIDPKILKGYGDMDQSTAPAEDVGEKKGREQLLSLYMSKDWDIEDFFNKFVEFFTKDICRFQDRTLTRSELEKIDLDDLENLIGKYIEFFFLSSWMRMA